MPALLEQIEARLHQLALADSDGTKYRGDQGRLNLLKEAVRLQDSFYMVLSQLFCLRTTSPSSLPQAVSHVVISEVSWRQLEALLCSNESLLAPNVAWFAEFPSPIMNIYSSEHPGFKAAYEAQVRAVADYLIKLPQQWHAMTEASIIRQAPPLTEDMVEQLSLHSPILQNTAFRAIARMYFAAVHLSNMEDGIQALVQLHRADQTQYAQGMRRSVAQKNNAYLAYRLLFNRWKQHDEWAKRHAERQHDPTYEFRGQPLIPFQIPLESLAAFGLQVLSSRNTPISQAQPQEQQQHQQPHAHAHPVRQRQGSISEQPPNPLPPQQLSMAQQSAHALASGQAWFRNAAHGSPLQVPHTTATTPQGGTARTPQPRSSLNPPIPQTTRLLPGANDGARPQPTHPDSTRSALHQAHLRDPTLVAAKVGAEIPKLYRQVETVCLSPTRIHEKRPTQLLTFELGDDCVATLPKQAVDDSGAPPRETLTEASREYRLRCCKIDLKMSFPNLSSWVEADNIWPDTVYFDFNGEPLDPRRKLQHGRYLPVDLTHLVQPGSNELKVTVNRTTTDMTPFDYAVAVEMVGAISHETLVSTLRTIPAKESLASMQQSLNGPSASDSNDEDDDDVKMISNSLTIKLFDPFSGNKIFDTPVRGELCLHRDPFDLDVFLSTREPRGHGAETPSAVDTWRCPICRKDVRPNILVQDGFLMEVRRELEAKGLLGTSRAIVVSADGTWRVKEEERKGVRSASLERAERARVVKVAKPPPVVIELD
ncbi:hypothetical protein B0A55_12794 [Friedmanniomyces simplex]|uniref:SP-RING-type domain-containing protein n=1 Tax=Friedmanniomyces simplex TaxID=329884 RepID=A0A4U0WDT4_9PEZI|nr:hypothetical protein B0A55_12794 [Friedmanniomyces simplex]